MKLKNKIAALQSICKEVFISKKTPLVISWHLINRCNQRCKYCYRWDDPSQELATNKIFNIIDQLRKLGTQVIIFSGGEPLLREDIGEILKYTHKNGIFTGLTSNGRLVGEKIEQLKTLDILKLSFDGPPEVHDFLRGSGSYESVMNAIEIAKENKLNIKLNTTLTKYNIGCVDYILKKAQELGLKVKFQPINHVHSVGKDLSALFPSENTYKQTILKLINLKRTNPHIINSMRALKYLYHWPRSAKISCYAGRLICCIMPNGDVSACSSMRDYSRDYNCVNSSMKDIFRNLRPLPSCKGCWCTSTLELNCLLSFNLPALLNARQLF